MKSSSVKILLCTLWLTALVACGGSGGGASPATNNTSGTATLTLPDLQGTVSGTTRVVANKIYNYSATEATGMTGAYTVDWGDGTPPFGLAAASATQDKIWRAAGNFTASLSRTKSDGTLVTATQTIAVVDKPVSMGNKHSCAIMSDNTVSCWGDNSYGQLGNGTLVNNKSPATVNGLTNVVSLAAYGYSTCAAKTDGTVWCWGWPTGASSSGPVAGITTPQQMATLSNIVALAGGEFSGLNHICALERAGTVKCWGSNVSGELGNGSALFHTGPAPGGSSPVSVTGLSDAVHIAASGQTTCAIKVDGTVWCWGYGGSGQVGAGVLNPSPTTTTISIPVLVPGVANAVSLALSNTQTCAVLSDTTVKCWGFAYKNQSSTTALGGLVLSPLASSFAPVTLAGISGVAALTLGANHACALKTDASVVCWGTYYWFYTAGANPYVQATPVAIVDASNAPLTNVLAASSGLDHTCALKEDGSVFCWGLNDKGQLGDGLNVDRNTAAQVQAASVGASFTQTASQSIAAGIFHTCAIKADKRVMCWGNNSYGQNGRGYAGGSTPIPDEVLGLTDAIALTAGSDHTCALKTTGGVTCWGRNDSGQLGNPNATLVPTLVGISGVSAIAAGSHHTCALKTTGEVFCWGNGFQGQLGATSGGSMIPVSVGISGVSAIASRWAHTCALKTMNDVICWGSNTYSQLGAGNINSQTSLPISAAITDVSALALGVDHSCVLKTSGDVECWGSGIYGELGNAINPSVSFTPVATSISGVGALVAGNRHNCALKTNGAVMCWGSGGFGQLGNSANLNSNIPVPVSITGGVSALVAGGYHTCALKTDGGVMCWGYGGYDQLGNPAYTTSNVPVNVIGITTQAAPVRTFWR